MHESNGWINEKKIYMIISSNGTYDWKGDHKIQLLRMINLPSGMNGSNTCFPVQIHSDMKKI